MYGRIADLKLVHPVISRSDELTRLRIPHADGHRDAKHTRGIECFPEETFGCRCIADRAESYFVTMIRKVFESFLESNVFYPQNLSYPR